ncbi:MAG: hypothetical protein IJ655_06675 [Lachnospiraceae bacterium]|nr:hypothetical protein [Lachnospiraceae bacterium]
MKKIHLTFETGKIIYMLMAVTFGLQLLVCLKLQVYFAGDAAIVADAASNQMKGGLNYFQIIYFLNNPNNLGMLYIDMFFLKISQLLGTNPVIIWKIVGMMLATISSGLTAFLTYWITDNAKMAYISYGICAFLIACNPWCVVPYTDIYSVCIPIAVFYTYAKRGQKGMCGWRRVLLPILLAFVGSLLKPTNILPGIAVIIVEVVSDMHHENRLNSLKNLGIVIVVAGALTMGLYQLEVKGVNYSYDEAYLKPWTHYVMMGLNEKKYGRYYKVDDEYTNSFLTKEEKMEANFEVIEQRLTKMGLPGYLKFVARKTVNTYGDGTFAWGIWSKDYRPLTLENIRNVIWLSVLAGLGLNIIVTVRRRLRGITESLVIMNVMLCLLVWMYLMLFETGARYVFMFAPCYILAGVSGIYRLMAAKNRNS